MAPQSEISTENDLSVPVDNAPTGPSELIQSLEIDSPSVVSEELERVAQRVRSRLKNMSADIIEIGCELRDVKQRLAATTSWNGSKNNVVYRHT